MDTPKVFESEYRFCLILWEHEPVRSSELVALCRERLGWKPTTIRQPSARVHIFTG